MASPFAKGAFWGGSVVRAFLDATVESGILVVALMSRQLAAFVAAINNNNNKKPWIVIGVGLRFRSTPYGLLFLRRSGAGSQCR